MYLRDSARNDGREPELGKAKGKSGKWLGRVKDGNCRRFLWCLRETVWNDEVL